MITHNKILMTCHQNEGNASKSGIHYHVPYQHIFHHSCLHHLRPLKYDVPSFLKCIVFQNSVSVSICLRSSRFPPYVLELKKSRERARRNFELYRDRFFGIFDIFNRRKFTIQWTPSILILYRLTWVHENSTETIWYRDTSNTRRLRRSEH